MNEKTKKLILKLKEPKMLIIFGLLGIFLIFISNFLPGGKKETSSNTSTLSTDSYREMLENSVREIVAGITGNGNATVVVTLENSIRYSYADATEEDSTSLRAESSEQESSSRNQSYITVRTADGGEEALLVTETMPEVRGVAVICNGGVDEESVERIRSAITAAFRITSKRIYVG